MTRRPLSPAEAALWQRVIATVEPLRDRTTKALGDQPAGQASPLPLTGGAKGGDGPPVPAPAPAAKPHSSPFLPTAPVRRPPSRGSIPDWTLIAAPPPPPAPAGTLDGHWDRRLARGAIAPDLTVDLHGHNLQSAYAGLDAALARAHAMGARVMLLITGKPRAPESGRGAIRAAVADWLTSSRHAEHIAAVRSAHPRHGGEGALYIVLRRRR